MVPETGHDTYLVLDDLGRLGRVWRETAEGDANREILIRDLLDDQYGRPRRIVAFNTAEGWSRAGNSSRGCLRSGTLCNGPRLRGRYAVIGAWVGGASARPNRPGVLGGALVALNCDTG
jgi:hypothetical protein